MDRNLENLKNLHANSRYNRTLQGRVFQWVGRIFALYCVFRTLSVSSKTLTVCVHSLFSINFLVTSQSILNILAPYHTKHSLGSDPHPRRSYPDLIAHLLTYMFSLLPFIHLGDESISVISRQVGLILVGVIILSSVRFVLRAVSRASVLLFNRLCLFLTPLSTAIVPENH